MTTVAVRADRLSKRYRIPEQRDGAYRTLREDLVTRFRLGANERSRFQTIDALKDISLELDRGEAVGVVGRNGAGKSTLMRILARVTKPTSGTADIFGRIGALLEVGTGFHPELTGRENVYLSGAILGLTRAETRSRFDEIIAFADIGPFIDTPVKRYSSGMFARLGFAVAAHLRPALLIVDEVLSVGDLAFQARCLARMRELTAEGTTVLFVSHNLRSLSDFCARSIYLESGRLVMDASTHDVIQAYRHRLAQADATWSDGHEASGLSLEVNGSPIADVAVHDPAAPLRLKVRARGSTTLPATSIVVNVVIETLDGGTVMHLRSDLEGTDLRLRASEDAIAVDVDYLPLNPGDYRLWLRLVNLEPDTAGLWDTERVLLTMTGPRHTDGIVHPRHRFVVEPRPASGIDGEHEAWRTS